MPLNHFLSCLSERKECPYGPKQDRHRYGRYLALQSKGSISLYGHACRLLKKYFAL